MNYENTLRALLEDAVPSFRRSLEDALVARLVDSQRSVLFELMRKAYDLGYRQALATQSVPTSDLQTNTLPVLADEDDDFEPEAPGADLFRIDAPEPDAGGVDGDDTEGEQAGEEPEEVAPPPEDEVKSDINWDLLADGPSDTAAARLVGERRPPNLRVRTSLTIGGLRDRVIKVFGLERFDIDVVVCRKGDRTRRQLKSTVRLSKYVVAGDV